jgi:UPF0716 protein FxsA
VFGRLVLLFVLTTLIEWWLLVLFSEHLGVATTIWLILITGFVGANLAKRQGLQTWHTIQRETQQGKVPAASMVDGMMIFVASVLLITPGMLTDVIGFSLLAPPVRAFLRHRFRNSFKVQAAASVQGFGAGFPGASPEAGTPDIGQSKPLADDVIDVEYHRHSED